MKVILLYSIICALLAMILSCILMIYVRSSMHALFLLATVYLTGTGFFMCLGHYVLAFIFLVTYLGAVIVLFIYVIILSNIQEIPLSEIKINKFFILASCSLPFVETFVAYTGHVSFVFKKSTDEEFQQLIQIFQNIEWISPARRLTVLVREYERTFFLEFLYNKSLDSNFFIEYLTHKIHRKEIAMQAVLEGYPIKIYSISDFWVEFASCQKFNLELFIKLSIVAFSEVFYSFELLLLEVPHIIMRSNKVIFYEIPCKLIEYKKIQTKIVDDKYLINNADIVFYNWFNDKVHIATVEQIAQFLYDHIILEISLLGLILLGVMLAVINLAKKKGKN